MKRAFLLSLILGVLSNEAVMAFDIQDQQLTPPGEEANRAIPFAIITKDIRIMLPVRSLYTSRVFNEFHTLAAINYHDTTDYDGVDLVIVDGKNIFVLPNIWIVVEQKAVQQKILQPQEWNRIEFTVKSITGNKLQCIFRGITAKTGTVIEKQFYLIVDTAKGALDLQLQ